MSRFTLLSRVAARLSMSLLIAALLCVWASSAVAQTSQFSEPSFLIEDFRIEGQVRTSPELILTETLLESGLHYGETELKQAIFRLQRLPFVLDATFAIEKGSERGSYVLVIRLEELKPWFFGEDSVFTRFTNSVAFDNPFADDFSLAARPLVGYRLFAGRYNVMFASIAANTGFQVGYTRYNLFDRRIVFSIGLTPNSCCPIQTFSLGLDPTFSSWQSENSFKELRLALGVPIGSRTSLQVQATSSSSEHGERQNLLGTDRARGRLEYFDRIHHTLDATFAYDSTDDPVFPSVGLKITAAADFQSVEADFVVPDRSFFITQAIDVPPELASGLPHFESRQWRVSGSVEQHWPLNRRLTVSLSARLAAGLAEVENLPVVEPRACPAGDFLCVPNRLRLIEDEDLGVFESLFTAGLSVDLWGQRRTRKYGDLRLETRIEFSYDQTSPDLDIDDNPLYRKSVTSSVAFRNAWGLFRFSLQVADFGRGF